MVHVAFRSFNKAANAKNKNCKFPVVKKIGGDRSKIIIHEDNAPVHTAKTMQRIARLQE